MPTEVFLSHSSKDAAAADRIVEVLRNHGVATFYSPRNILGAQQWHDEIGAALQRADWFVVLALTARSQIEVGQTRTDVRADARSV
ncbi:MAG: toll/interleukin-1 receptor domain-containing protein [Planctomycetaceae bacterium]